MSRLKRSACLGLSAVVGLLLVTVLQISLAWASEMAADGMATGPGRVQRGVRGSASANPDAPSVALTKTVGNDPTQCAATDGTSVAAGTSAVYCYTIRNTGTVTLTNHYLVDSHLGNILINFPYSLAPGASAFLTQSTTLTRTTVNSATWTAVNPGLLVTVTASDQATVTVIPLSIALSKTVGLDPGQCATSSRVALPIGGGNVIYCYEVTNTGPITMTRHDLRDSHLGLILNNFPYALAPGASAFLTESALITMTTVNYATWTVRSTYTVLSATAVSSATVSILHKRYLPIILR